MGRIFISHASIDNAKAAALAQWLSVNGWDDFFLDFDAERGIAPGERWRKALYDAAHRCEAVIFLISKHWLNSEWCVREFDLAVKLSNVKRLFGVLIDDVPLNSIPARFTDEWQFADLHASGTKVELEVIVPPNDERSRVPLSEYGLARLREGLKRAGLDPETFAWPPERKPYHGLSPLEEDDAAIFYGRDARLSSAIGELETLVAGGGPRLFVIQGASGAGKSSFLRAGLLPRLKRRDHTFLTLQPIRPSNGVIDRSNESLSAALSDAFQEHGRHFTPADACQLVFQPENLISRLGALASSRRVPELPGQAAPRAPAIVFSIDQAEELFHSEDEEQAQKFLQLIKYLTDTDHRIVVGSEKLTLRTIFIFTIRTAAYEQLQGTPALAGLPQTVFSLGPIHRGAFKEVIEGPARRRSQATRTPLVIEPALTDRLIADIGDGGQDTLPMLAFTLERLYDKYGNNGAITLKNYKQFGEFGGAISSAVRDAFAAMDADGRVPSDHQARLALLRDAFVPWMAEFDEASNEPRRKVARMSDLPEAAIPLLEHFVEARLLVLDVSMDEERTIEPAHEALLRQWAPLDDWLNRDRKNLLTLDDVRRAAKAWRQNDKKTSWLVHRGANLSIVERLRSSSHLARALGQDEWTYVKACRTRARKQATWAGSIVTSFLALVGLWYAGYIDPVYVDGQINYVRNMMKEDELKVGSLTRDCAGACPDMKVLPPGRFVMGTNRTNVEDLEDAQPRREITVSREFLVSKFEITFEEWDYCRSSGGCAYEPPDHGWGRGTRPVMAVSWNDAQQYVSWLSRKTGLSYRLLTEAEWEYAARGIQDASARHPTFSWGNDIGTNNANCGDCGSNWDGMQTAPVGSFEPNSFGLYDMHGNVFEWVGDCYYAERYKAPTTDPSAPPERDGCLRVLRGGSWKMMPDYNLHAAFRLDVAPDARDLQFGFRVARDLLSGR